MATESPIVRDGSQCTAVVDLSSYKYYLLQIVGSKQLGLMTGGTGQVFYGVLQNTPMAGEACDVAIMGITKVVAGAPITYGQQLMPNGSGQSIPWLSGNLVIGVALESASTDELFSALVIAALN